MSPTQSDEPRCLALDTSSRLCSVALVAGEAVLARRAREAAPAEVVLGLVDEVLAEAGLCRRELDLLAVGLGPGVFTGTRVGVATAKGMALALGRPLLGVGSLVGVARASDDARGVDARGVDARGVDARGVDARGVDARGVDARGVRAPDADRALGVIVDAGRGEVYGAAYELGTGVAEVRVAPFLASPDDARATLEAFVSVAAASLGLGLPVAAPPDASWIAREAVRRWRRGERDPLEALEPSYVRPSDAKLPSTPLRMRPSG